MEDSKHLICYYDTTYKVRIRGEKEKQESSYSEENELN